MIVVGTNEAGGKVQMDERTHLQVRGGSQTGKSRLIEHLCLELFKKRKSFALIDPHAHVYERLLRRIALLAPFREEDVVLFDASAPNPHGFAPFHFEGSVEELHTQARNLSTLTLQMWGIERPDDRPRFKFWLFTLYYTMMEQRLTLAQGLDLLRYESPNPGGAMAREWAELQALSRRDFAAFVEPLRSRLMSFTHPRLAKMLERRTFDLAGVTEGKVLLANLQETTVLTREENRTLSALFFGTFWHAVLRKRPEFWLVVDEFQVFANDTVADMLDQLFKFGLRVWAFHHREANISKNLLEAFEVNAVQLRFTGRGVFTWRGHEVRVPHVPDLRNNAPLDALAERFRADRSPGPVEEPPPRREAAPEQKLPGRGGEAHRRMQETVRGVAAKHGFRARVEHDGVDVALEGHGVKVAVQVSVGNDASYEANAAARALARYDQAVVVTASPAKARKLESLGVRVVDYAGLLKFLASFASEREWVTAKEFARMRGFHVATVRGWCRDGKLPAEQHGREWRINLGEVASWTPPETPRKVSTQKVKTPRRKKATDPDGFREIMGLE